MSIYMAEETLQMGLSQEPSGTRIILDYQRGSRVIARVLVRQRQEAGREPCEGGSRGQGDSGKKPLDKEADGWSVEAGIARGTNSSLDFPKELFLLFHLRLLTLKIVR